ncbi:MAG: DUF2975 domain-containing protein [Acutalibacteraceae bacterium]
MSQKALSFSLKFIIVLMLLCAFSVLCLVSLMMIISDAPEIEQIRIPWMLFLWSTGIPVAAAAVFAWMTATNIGHDKSFCLANAKNLRAISILAAADAVWFFAGNFILLFLNMNHPGVVLFSMVIVLVGAAISVAAACLSHLIVKAADLQTESDLTI